MSFRTYQPANWSRNNEWSRFGYDDSDSDDNNYSSQFQRPNRFNYTDNFGRECQVTCRPRQRPPFPSNNIGYIIRIIIGLTLNEARRYYNNIREVIRNGEQLPVTLDYNPRRINVETSNGRIIRVVSLG